MAARIGIVTLGCDKNTVDSEYFAGQLARAGIEVVAAGQEPAGDDLDAVLINTCGFIEDAKTESIRAILAWGRHKKRCARQGRRFRVFVVGCLSQRYRESLARELPEVDGFMGVGEFERVVELVRSPADTASQVNLVREVGQATVSRKLPRTQLEPVRPYGFLKIADGCNHRCAFCAIPSFKGRLRSVPRAILLAEARMLLSRGVREINLVAQDTSVYGKDLYGNQYGIADLLADLSALRGDFWLRLLYFYPGGITSHFLEAFRSLPKVVRYLDMPLQHLHPDTLRRMNRPHRTAKAGALVPGLRAVAPGIALRTTFLVGFPGETAEEFRYLRDGVRRMRFDRLGVFSYSPEEDTVAATMRPSVPKRVRESRRDQLMRLQAGISAELNQALVGREMKVLIEERLPDGRYLARSERDAPEVDGQVSVSSSRELKAGDFVMVRVTDAEVYDLAGTHVP